MSLLTDYSHARLSGMLDDDARCDTWLVGLPLEEARRLAAISASIERATQGIRRAIAAIDSVIKGVA